MILNSRKRRQIEQQQRAGQTMLVDMGKRMIDAGKERGEASKLLSWAIAEGSTEGSWWADVGFMRRLKGQMKRAE